MSISTTTRLTLVSLLLSAALSDVTFSVAPVRTVKPQPQDFHYLIRLRGGEAKQPSGNDDQAVDIAGLVSGPHGSAENFHGSWSVITSTDTDGDELTIFRHSGTGVIVEVNHEYSDGGIQFLTSASEHTKIITHENVCANSIEGFKIDKKTRDLVHTGTDLAGFDSNRPMGDWNCTFVSDFGTLKLTNTFYNSVLYLHHEGNFVFLTNPVANKSFGSAWGKYFELDRKAGTSLNDFLHQGRLNMQS